jgi:hypothetical protein
MGPGKRCATAFNNETEQVSCCPGDCWHNPRALILENGSLAAGSPSIVCLARKKHLAMRLRPTLVMAAVIVLQGHSATTGALK